MKSTFIFFIACYLTGCFYPKVTLDRDERKLIFYDKRKYAVFHSNTGLTDTVYFKNIGYSGGFEPNFDFWWSKNISGNKGTKRGFYYSVSATSNFPKNKYTDKNLNLYLNIRLKKSSDKDSLWLSIDQFDDEFPIINGIPDTLIFKKPKSNESCKHCLRRVTWTSGEGIILFEKNDDTVWKR